MQPALLWLRRDLRVSDNPALAALLDEGLAPVPVYIHFDPDDAWPLGEASAWWLHHSLKSLTGKLESLGSRLLLLRGDPQRLLPELCETLGIERVAWNRCHEPAWTAFDSSLAQKLCACGIQVTQHNADLLCSPDSLLKDDGTPYRVFTPFWKALQSRGTQRGALPAPQEIPRVRLRQAVDTCSLGALDLLPEIKWYADFEEHGTPGEDAAAKALEDFIDGALIDYKSGRDRLDQNNTSRLSAHLHFGEISAIQAWDRINSYTARSQRRGIVAAGEAWLRQLVWREFSYHILHHFPDTPLHPMDARFTEFPWHDDYADDLRRWQRGRTGIPMVDAGMRQLWHTGYMHNRARLIVASFLTKNLLIPWQEGARWFWNTLVDADLANNTMGWQWTAGCGVDAAPYFRVFNPVLQGKKFDPEGRYIRRWMPELKQLDDKYIHAPWEAGDDELREAQIKLGEDYPEPIVDLKESREQALEAWERIKA